VDAWRQTTNNLSPKFKTQGNLKNTNTADEKQQASNK